MNFVRTISVIALCLLVMVTSSSFMVGIHFCRGTVQDIALFQKAERCTNEKQLPECHRHQTNPCCEDKTILHEGDDIKSDVAKIQLSEIHTTNVDHPMILISEVIPSSLFVPTKAKYYNYDPPLPSADRTISLQVFLI